MALISLVVWHNKKHFITGRAAWAHFHPPFFEDLFPGVPRNCDIPRVEAHSQPATEAHLVGWWSGGHTVAGGGLLEMTVTRCWRKSEIMCMTVMLDGIILCTLTTIFFIFPVWRVGQWYYAGSWIWRGCGRRLLWWRRWQGDSVWLWASLSQRTDRCTDFGHHASGATGGYQQGD